MCPLTEQLEPIEFVTTPRYLDPKNDLIFKKIFGHHPDLLKSFLNAVLPLPEDCVIEKITYLTPESVPELQEMEYSRTRAPERHSNLQQQ
jgi:hypothetical protein